MPTSTSGVSLREEPTSAATQPTGEPLSLLLPVEHAQFTRMVFQEDFDDPQSGWRNDAPDDTKKTLARYEMGPDEDGVYSIAIQKQNSYSRWTSRTDVDLADFSAEVEVQFDTSAGLVSGGLLFRLADNQNFYRVNVYNDGTYIARKRVDEQWVALEGDSGKRRYFDRESLGVEQVLLGVLVEGTDITVYINGEQQHVYSDSTFSSGGIGLYGSVYEEEQPLTASVQFDNLIVYGPVLQPQIINERQLSAEEFDRWKEATPKVSELMDLASEQGYLGTRMCGLFGLNDGRTVAACVLLHKDASEQDPNAERVLLLHFVGAEGSNAVLVRAEVEDGEPRLVFYDREGQVEVDANSLKVSEDSRPSDRSLTWAGEMAPQVSPCTTGWAAEYRKCMGMAPGKQILSTWSACAGWSGAAVGSCFLSLVAWPVILVCVGTILGAYGECQPVLSCLSQAGDDPAVVRQVVVQPKEDETCRKCVTRLGKVGASSGQAWLVTILSEDDRDPQPKPISFSLCYGEDAEDRYGSIRPVDCGGNKTTRVSVTAPGRPGEPWFTFASTRRVAVDGTYVPGGQTQMTGVSYHPPVKLAGQAQGQWTRCESGRCQDGACEEAEPKVEPAKPDTDVQTAKGQIGTPHPCTGMEYGRNEMTLRFPAEGGAVSGEAFLKVSCTFVAGCPKMVADLNLAFSGQFDAGTGEFTTGTISPGGSGYYYHDADGQCTRATLEKQYFRQREWKATLTDSIIEGEIIHRPVGAEWDDVLTLDELMEGYGWDTFRLRVE